MHRKFMQIVVWVVESVANFSFIDNSISSNQNDNGNVDDELKMNMGKWSRWNGITTQ